MHLLHSAAAALSGSSPVHMIGVIFHPIFVALATVLVAIYGVTASYGLAIILLTIVIMALLMPLTVRSTRSMIALAARRAQDQTSSTAVQGPGRPRPTQ